MPDDKTNTTRPDGYYWVKFSSNPNEAWSVALWMNLLDGRGLWSYGTRIGTMLNFLDSEFYMIGRKVSDYERA